MNKEEIIKATLDYIIDDVKNKDFLTYEEQNEWIDYLNRLENHFIKLKEFELQQENKQLQDNWNKLKEYLEENWKQSQDIWFVKIINKMQELEKGDNND